MDCVFFARYWSCTLPSPQGEEALGEFSLHPRRQRAVLLRFHLGSQAANKLLNTPELRQMLDGRCVEKLNDFLGQLGNRVALERTYALLGQSYLSHVMYCQMDDVGIALSTNFQEGPENIVHIMARYKQKLMSLVDAFEGFHDLEDDDGDEDEEEYRLAWDISSSDDDVDEPDGR
jgi:hypothetical protein